MSENVYEMVSDLSGNRRYGRVGQFRPAEVLQSISDLVGRKTSQVSVVRSADVAIPAGVDVEDVRRVMAERISSALETISDRNVDGEMADAES